MSTTRSGPLSASEQSAWRAFLHANGAVTRRLEADLQAEHGMSLGAYEVLVHLSEANEQRLRMAELAQRVLLSRSGLTRQVDRLERAGLVRREACDTDARGTFAVLTPAGRRQLEAAYPAHLRGVRRYVINPLTAAELATLAELLARMAAEAEAAD